MKIVKNMTVSEILIMDRALADIFVSYNFKCLGCPSASIESLEQVAVVHKIDLDALLKDLNENYNGD
ncbi:MAG: DUF1858 domain-containing protein [Bacillota bacterium]|nr:DUF1858 domain-containing protein [Bacillota bacterium]